VAGGTIARVLDGLPPEDLGPPPGQPAAPLDLLLERCVSHLSSGFARLMADGDYRESVALARLACAVGDDGPHADVFAAVLAELDAFERDVAPADTGQRFRFSLRHLVHALVIARTPDVPLPADRASVAPTRAHAE
jgi:uncharacterized protein